MSKQKSTWGGPGRGGGRPANIDASLARLERSVAAAERRPTLSYEEALRLWRRAEKVTERIEALMVGAPDYPDA